MKKKILLILLVVTVFFSCSLMAYGHSGGTDSNGGHRDNKNVSGLGPYHYHHGYGPHLHPNGVCPYASKPTINYNNNTSTTYGSKTNLPSSTSKPTFPVIVNNKNLNVTSSGYYPIVIGGVTYVPLSSEVINILNLSGGWKNSTEGLILNSKTKYSNNNWPSPVSKTKINLPAGASKPTFPVIVNNKNLNVTSSGYYPIVIGGVTYVPLSSEVINSLNLSGGWKNSTEGLILNSK